MSTFSYTLAACLRPRTGGPIDIHRFETRVISKRPYKRCLRLTCEPP